MVKINKQLIQYQECFDFEIYLPQMSTYDIIEQNNNNKKHEMLNPLKSVRKSQSKHTHL